MSRVPYLMRGVRFDGPRMGDYTVTDGLTLGLSCPIYDYHMGVTAENVAERFEVSREAQDELGRQQPPTRRHRAGARLFR